MFNSPKPYCVTPTFEIKNHPLEKFAQGVLISVRKRTKKVLFASLMDICHLTSAELETKHQMFKGRVVLQGDFVKDDSGSYAAFTEQGSSASQMTAQK